MDVLSPLEPFEIQNGLLGSGDHRDTRLCSLSDPHSTDIWEYCGKYSIIIPSGAGPGIGW